MFPPEGLRLGQLMFIVTLGIYKLYRVYHYSLGGGGKGGVDIIYVELTIETPGLWQVSGNHSQICVMDNYTTNINKTNNHLPD